MNILQKPIAEILDKTQQQPENKTFNLLNPLSSSGSLPITCAEIHALVGATLCFDLSIVDTMIQQNVHPIEKLELSMLIVALMIHAYMSNVANC